MLRRGELRLRGSLLGSPRLLAQLRGLGLRRRPLALRLRAQLRRSSLRLIQLGAAALSEQLQVFCYRRSGTRQPDATAVQHLTMNL